jgi:hypothetical protein
MAIWNQLRTCSLAGAITRRASGLLRTIRDEGDILVGLNALLLEIVEDAPQQLAIVAVDEIDRAGTTIFEERAADDEFDVFLPLVAVTNIAAMEANDDAALWNG